MCVNLIGPNFEHVCQFIIGPKKKQFLVTTHM